MQNSGTDGAAFTIAMTDIFISAGAALMLVLALLPLEVPKKLSIQANLSAVCPPGANGDDYLILPSPVSGSTDLENSAIPSLSGNIKGIAIRTSSELADASRILNPTPGMLVIIALTSAEGRPLTAKCLRDFQVKIVKPHNLKGKENTAEQSHVIFSVVPVDTISVITEQKQ